MRCRIRGVQPHRLFEQWQRLVGLIRLGKNFRQADLGIGVSRLQFDSFPVLLQRLLSVSFLLVDLCQSRDGLCILGVFRQRQAVFLLCLAFGGIILGRVQQFRQLKMSAWQMGIDSQCLSELGNRRIRLTSPSLFMGHQLMHLRGIRRGKRQGEHGFTGQIGVCAISRVQNLGIIRGCLAQLGQHAVRLFKIPALRVKRDQLQANLDLKFQFVDQRECRLKILLPGRCVECLDLT